MSALTLDEWVERAGFLRFREEVFTHAQAHLSDREAEELTRNVMISLRQEVVDSQVVNGRMNGDRFQPDCVHSKIYAGWTTHFGRIMAIEELPKEGAG